MPRRALRFSGSERSLEADSLLFRSAAAHGLWLVAMDMSESEGELDFAADAVSQAGGPTPKKAKNRRAAEEVECSPTPATGQGQHARPVKAASPSAAMNFTCTLCRKTHEAADKVPGFLWGRQCKRAYDSLRRLAVKQKEMDWWADVKEAPKKMKALVTDFLRMFPVAPGRGQSRARGFKLSEYKEYMRSTTEVERRAAGKMMWEEEYYEFAKSTAGGGYTAVQAKEKWQKMAAEDSGVLRCMDGPEHSPIMLRIQTGIYISNINKFGIEKELSMSNGPTKNPNEADIAAGRHNVFSGHDMVGGVEVGDLGAIARNMVAAGAGDKGDAASSFTGTFNHEGITDVNLRQHFMKKALTDRSTPDGKKRKREDCEEAPNEESEESDGPEEERRSALAAPRKKLKATAYFDKTRVNAKNTSTWMLFCQELESSAKACLDQLRSYEKRLSTGDDSCKAVFQPTLQVVTDKIGPLEMVLEDSDAKLLATLAKYDKESQTAPIEKYRNLKTIADLRKQGEEKYKACGSQSDVKEASKELLAHKQAMQQLVNVCKGVVTDAKRAVSGRQRLAQLEKKLDGKETHAQSSAAHGKTNASVFWDTFGEQGMSVLAVKDPMSEHDRFTMDLTKPLLVSSVEWCKQASKDNSALAVMADSFKNKFHKWAAKTHELRGGARIKDETQSQVCESNLIKALGSALIIRPDTGASECQELIAALAPSFFALSSGEVFSSSETESLACLRIAKDGTRVTVCAPMEHVLKFMKSEAEGPGEQNDCFFSPDAIKEYFLNMSREKIERYLKKKHEAYHATVGPSDMLYMPAGFVLAEMVMNKVPVIGYRMSILSPVADTTIQAMRLHKDLGGNKTVADHVIRLMSDSKAEAEAQAQALAVAAPQLKDLGAEADAAAVAEGEPAAEDLEEPEAGEQPVASAAAAAEAEAQADAAAKASEAAAEASGAAAAAEKKAEK